MDKYTKLLIEHKKQIFSLLLLVLLSGVLRFYNLGYSEFQDDEKKAIINVKKDSTVDNFLLNQRKGPMQFFVTQLTIKAGVDSRDEAAMRIPFAVMSTLSVIVFYLVLAQYFKSEAVRLFGSLLFLTNGFFVGFGRIVQYQNINILFSLLALLMFVFVSKRTSKNAVYAFFGVVFFCISLMAHWDAVFFVVPIALLYLQFLIRAPVSRSYKLITTVLCVLLGSALLLPYLIPYRDFQLSNPANLKYYDRRLGFSSYPFSRHKFIFELYNPFLTSYLISGLVILSVFTLKKSWLFWIWFIFNFITIKYLMQKPGTHIYNYVIPAIFLSTFAIDLLTKNARAFKLSAVMLLGIIALLYFQSYMIFVDHKQEYPWDKKTIFKFNGYILDTQEYIDKEVLTFGFPHYRGWKQINEFIAKDPSNCTYITNEGKEISQIYMKTGFGIKNGRKCYYVVDVKRPFITGARDAKFAEASGKEPVFVYINPDTYERLVEVYKKNQKLKTKD